MEMGSNNKRCNMDESDDEAYCGLNRGSFLAWEDLRVMLPSFGKGPTKRLLNGLNGFAEPGRIMAIMGPSGSGKSTLLDTLAGSLLVTSFLYYILYICFFGCHSSSFLNFKYHVFGKEKSLSFYCFLPMEVEK